MCVVCYFLCRTKKGGERCKYTYTFGYIFKNQGKINEILIKMVACGESIGIEKGKDGS